MLIKYILFFVSLAFLLSTPLYLADTWNYENLSSADHSVYQVNDLAEPTYYPTGIPPESPIDSPPVTIEPTQIGGDYGWVYLESVPSGADASFDGISQGTTPVSVKVMSAGSPYHQIWMQKSGYQEWSTSISENPASGQTIPVKAVLISLPPTDTPTQTPTTYPTPTSTPTPTLTFPPTVIPTTTPVPTMIGGDYGWVSIDSIPQGAEITFDQIFPGPSPAMVKVFSTETPYHQIIARMSGYYDWTYSLTQNPGPEDTIPVIANLVPIALYGSIRVTSNPSGSIAVIDGGLQDLTPCTFDSLVPGLHTVRIIHDGYQPYSEQTRVTSGGLSQINAGLSPVIKAGTIYVTSNPGGADIYLDQGYQGQTPFLVSASSGNHRIELKLAGYLNYQSEVNIIPGQQTSFYATLSPDSSASGSIQVASSPGGSSVRLNGDYYGETPHEGYLDITSLTPGIYNILISHPQNQDYSGNVAVTARQTTTVNVALQASPQPSSINGTLYISSNPSGAYIFLDNQIKGITPLILPSLNPGIYTLTLRTDGYQDAIRQVNISAGRETDAIIDMTITGEPTTNPVTLNTTYITPVPTGTESPAPVLPVISGLCLLFICCYLGKIRR